MLKKLLFITVGLLFTAVSAKGQLPASLKFKTVEVSDFVAHPDPDDEEDGFAYQIRYFYPSEFSDKAVLEKLQYGLNLDTFGEDFARLSPEQALSDFCNDWAESYLDEIDEYPMSFVFFQYDTLLFANNDLLQFMTISGAQSPDTTFTNVGLALFDLHTGNKYGRDDIFKPEEAGQITKFLITEIQKQFEIDVEKDTPWTADDVWTEDSAFAVFEHGILFYFVDFRNTYGMEEPGFLIPYETILPYLRTGTTVWNLADGK